MLVKTVAGNDGRKWEIYKLGDDDYIVKLYEHFLSCGWREVKIPQYEHYSKGAIEWEFDIEVV